MPYDLNGKRALITGATSGIGEAAARALSRAGASVCLAGRRQDRLEHLVGEFSQHGQKAHGIAGDIACEPDVQKMVEQCADQLGGIDILINSAGMIDAGGVETLSLEQWRRVIDVNLMGTIYACKYALPHIKQQACGDIINISSTAGRMAAGLMGAYSTSKFGLTGFSEGLRQEVGQTGVRVAIIEPGTTRTEVARGISDPQWQESMQKHVSREGAMEPDDVAEAIMFTLALPRRANVSQMLIRPTDSAPPF